MGRGWEDLAAPRRRSSSSSALSRALALFGAKSTTMTFSTPEARRALLSLSFSSSNLPEGRLAIILRASSPRPLYASLPLHGVVGLVLEAGVWERGPPPGRRGGPPFRKLPENF